MVIKTYILLLVEDMTNLLVKKLLMNTYFYRNQNYDLNIVELDFSEKHKFFQEQYEVIDEIIDEGAEDIKDSQLVLIDRVGYGFYYEQRKKSTRNQFALLDYHMKKTMSFNHNFYLSISSSGVAIVLSSIALGGA